MIGRRIIPLIAIIPSLISASPAQEEKTRIVPSQHWAAWLHIRIPDRFTLDPRSFKGENKWWAKFDDPDSPLTVEITSYGYISDLDLILTAPGVTWENYSEKLGQLTPTEFIATHSHIKNTRDYFIKHLLPKGADTKPTRKVHGYELYIHRGNDELKAYFLDEDTATRTYGNSYKTLRFTFPPGKYDDHRTTIDTIIASTDETLKPREDLDEPPPEPEGTGQDKPPAKPAQ